VAYVDMERQRTAWVLAEARRRCSHRAKPGDRERYFERGIAVDSRWCGRGALARFLEDMGPRPSPQHELDRIDNELGYEPGNVRWVTQEQQDANRRPNPRTTPPDVCAEIVTALLDGASYASQARRFNLHEGTPKAILLRYQSG
jgi:hypothetical protein